jgi:putative GTP pyrophosphokinase
MCDRLCRLSSLDYRAWYKQNIPKYESIAAASERFIKHSLINEAIEYPLIASRAKDFESFAEKMERKKYSHPEEMTDIAGIRIVCFVLSDVKLVSSIIEQIFYVDWDNSVDKFKELVEKGKMGYRGTNYSVKCRKDIFEDNKRYEEFKNIPFEIQIRSLLDYAWGEIEHDRNYKLAEEFPRESNIPRRFEALAGALETLDYSFDSLARETQQYAKPITNKIYKGDLNIPINPLSLREFLTLNFRDLPSFRPYFVSVNRVLDELKSLQILTISELNEIIPSKYKEACKSVARPEEDRLTLSLITREVLILHNQNEYFSKAWNRTHFDTLDNHTYRVSKKMNITIKLPKGLEWED